MVTPDLRAGEVVRGAGPGGAGARQRGLHKVQPYGTDVAAALRECVLVRVRLAVHHKEKAGKNYILQRTSLTLQVSLARTAGSATSLQSCTVMQAGVTASRHH